MRPISSLRIGIGLLITLMLSAMLPTALLADGAEWRGLISTRPTDGTVGAWTIGGRSFIVTTTTRVRLSAGPLDIGACAEVEFMQDGTENYITEIESKSASRCGGSSGGGGGGQDNGDDEDDDEDENDDEDEDDDAGSFVGYGLIAGYPSSLVGGWRIGTVDYTATSSTEFDDDEGPFGVGACVEYKAADVSGTLTLREVETAESYKCSGGGTNGGQNQQRTSGVLGDFPTALVGTWTVGTTVFTATETTRFEQDEGPFLSGVCVAVRHAGGTLTASEIKTVEAYRCSGAQQTPLTRAYGIIGTVAETTPGTWVIGGAEYAVTQATQLDTEDGELLAGSCAGVKFSTVNGVNTATEIEAEGLAKCQPNTFRSRLRGTVTLMPADRYGIWLIGETPVEAVTTTRFDQEDGLLAEGVCVKVKYYVLDGVNYASEIETDDDCGTSDGTTATAKVYGLVESLPADPFIGEWVIGGVNYTATANTEFEEDDGRTFAVDGCVEARFTMVAEVATLLKVETKHPDRCGTDPSAGQRAYGPIDVLPDPIGAGVWTIAGIDYRATLTTTLSEEHGLFGVGAFAEVTYLVEADGTLTALSIATHVAPGDGTTNVVGELEVEPDVETGEWVVDGVTYEGDPAISVDLNEVVTTQQLRSGRVGTEPLTVAVNSYRGLDGVRYVTSIVLTEPPIRYTFFPFGTR